MATLVAIGYPDQGTAEQARHTVEQLEADLIIQADQVAAISRDLDGKYHVHTTHGGASAGGGAVWWLLGLAVWTAVLRTVRRMGRRGRFGCAVRPSRRERDRQGVPAAGARLRQAGDVGALHGDRAGDAGQGRRRLEQYGGTVIKTSLSDEDTKKLQDALQPPADVGARVPLERSQAAAGAYSVSSVTSLKGRTDACCWRRYS